MYENVPYVHVFVWMLHQIYNGAATMVVSVSSAAAAAANTMRPLNKQIQSRLIPAPKHKHTSYFLQQISDVAFWRTPRLCCPHQPFCTLANSTYCFLSFLFFL